jgi:LPS sulfotransferase NodH
MNGHTKDFPAVWNYLKDQDLKIIVLIRKNTFREALSSFRARKIGVFHSAEDSSLAEQKVNVDAALLKKRVDELEAINANILQLSQGKDRIVLTYEEFEEWQTMLDKVFEFLAVEKIEMQPELRKISAANWRNGVENYQQVEATMKEKYAHFLN